MHQVTCVGSLGRFEMAMGVGRAVYRQRLSVAESPFGVIERVMGVWELNRQARDSAPALMRWVEDESK